MKEVSRVNRYCIDGTKPVTRDIVTHLLKYGEYRFEQNRKWLYSFTGKYWRVISEDLILKRIVQITWDYIKNKDVKEIYEHFRLRISTPSTKSAVEENLINLNNGVLDLNKKKLLPHSKSYFFTSIVPIDYDKEAICPKWKSFLGQVTKGSVELQLVIQELFGYCLIPGNKEQVFFVLLGTGGNGKSVLLSILRSILGKENTSSLSFADLSDKFRVVHLVDKLANITDESPTGKALESEMLKNLSAGGQITVEEKYKSPFQVECRAKLIFSANSPIKLKDHTYAIKRRLKVIPFNFQVSNNNINKDLVCELEQELPGILNWAIEGLQRLRDNESFSECDFIEEAVDKFLTDNDSVKQFVDENCKINNDCKIYVQDIYRNYVDFCQNCGFSPCSTNEFGKRLLSHFQKKVRKDRENTGDRRYYYSGVEMHDISEFHRNYPPKEYRN